MLALVEQIHPKLIKELGSLHHILHQLQIVLLILDILLFQINNYKRIKMIIINLLKLTFSHVFESTMVLPLGYELPCFDFKIYYLK